ncbi:TonB-dependent receptor [Sphingomonas adhaesiva]|uniref:TonB-dependent receptor n=1 Tax=Sphingomonas adhaesiva TaxID=28212 RepID=UPI002FF9A7DA
MKRGRGRAALGRGYGGMGAAIVLALSPVAARAQETGGDAVAGDDLIVTASGRPETQAEVPLSVQGFDQRDLRGLAIRDVRDLAAFVPGVFVETQYPSTPAIVIRGISTDTADVTAEPRISVYQDGVYVSRPQSALFELYDLARVEVVKGPQPTLFGRGALTGAISVVQNKADPRAAAARVTAGVGDLEAYRAEGMVNLPLSSAVAVRIAGVARREDGYVRNLAGGPDLNGNRIGAVRGAVHADLPGGGAIDLIGNVQRDRFTGLSYKSGTFAPSDPATGAPLGTTSPFTPAYLNVAADFPRGGLGGSRDLAGATLLLDQPLGGDWGVSATAAWTRFRTSFVGDFDGSALLTAASGEITRGRQLSAEVRVRYAPTGGISAILGASVAEERGTQDILTQIDERDLLALQTGFLDRRNTALLPNAVYRNPALVAGQLAGIAGAFGMALPAGQAAALAANLQANHRERLLRASRARFYEGFASIRFEPAARLAIEGGMRVTLADKRSDLATVIEQRSILAGFFGALTQPAVVRDALLGALSVPGAAAIPPSAAYPVPQFGLLYQPTAGSGDSASIDRAGVSGSASLRYAASPSLNLYATYARGRRPEVLSPQPPLAPGAPARFSVLAAETVDSIEAGAKLRRGTVRLDGAMFAYRYRHFQTELLQGTTLVSVDAGRGNAWGGEVSARYDPLPALGLFASYGYTHARFGDGLYEGNRFRLSPDHQAAAGGTVTVPGHGGTLSIEPALVWRSRIYFDNSNGDLSQFAGAFLTPLPFQSSQAPYARVNLHLGYAPDRGRWRLDAFATNLLDRRYVRDIGTGSLSFGLPSYIAAPPRAVRAELTIMTGGAR